jgi:hypothetical protein
VWPVGDAAVLGAGMAAFEDIKPGSGVDPAGIAEIAQVSRFAPTPEPGVYTEVLSKSETQRLRGFLDFSAATAHETT